MASLNERQTMKTAHTLGPWKWIQKTDSVVSDHPDMKWSIIAKIATGENREEEDANARLIAAAPELLEALQGMVDALQSGLLAYNTSPGAEAGRRLLAARAAIAKSNRGGCPRNPSETPKSLVWHSKRGFPVFGPSRMTHRPRFDPGEASGYP
jgi:hypothetical protein